jgi:hypothetical protein
MEPSRLWILYLGTVLRGWIVLDKRPGCLISGPAYPEILILQ